MPCCLTAPSAREESRRGVRVQAAGPRRRADGGRDRPLARRGGPGDRRGRPAGRGADRQDDGRDPVAGGGQGRAHPRVRGRRRPGRNRAGRDRRRRHRARRGGAAARRAGRVRSGHGPGTVPEPWPSGTCPSDPAHSAHGRRTRSRAFLHRSDRAAGPRDGGRRPTSRVRGTVPGAGPGRTARAVARGSPPRRRAHEPRPPRGAARDLGRGVRLLERRAQAARPEPCSRRSPRACRSSPS